MIQKAVIVAAGLSSRLYPLTLERPKGLLPIGAQSLLERSVQLLSNRGITNIAVVVGYKHEMIRSVLGNAVHYVTNPFYQHCNNMGSLWFAKSFVGNDSFAYLHGDIVYDEAILADSLKHANAHANDLELVTDFSPTNEEAMKVRVTDGSYLVESNKQIPIQEAAGEWTGIAFIKNAGTTMSYIEGVMMTEGLNFYDTHAFSQMARDGYKVYCSPTGPRPWLEIDFLEDYERAQELFK